MRRIRAVIVAVGLLGPAFLVPLGTAPPASAQILPSPVDVTQLANTPVRGGWGVSGLDPDRQYNFDTVVWDFAQIGNRVFVAGAFLEVRQNRTSTPYDQPYLAAFDLYTGAWISQFAPRLDAPAYSLAVSPRGTLLVGGEFTSVNGVANTSGLASLDPLSGAVDVNFQASVQRPWSTYRAVVRELQLVGDTLYLAGNFSHVRGNSDAQRGQFYKAARVNARWGTPDFSWKPRINSSGVWGMAIDPGRGRAHFAGFFSDVAGAPNTARYAVVDLTTGAPVSGLTPLLRNSANQIDLYDVAYAADKVWVAGSEHIVEVLDANNHNMIGYHTTSYLGCNGNPFYWCNAFTGGGDYQVVQEVGNYVIGGCHCVREYSTNGTPNHYSSFDGQRFPTLLAEAYDKNTGRLVPSFIPDLAGSQDGVWAVGSDTLGCLWLGGQFTVGGLKTGNSFWVGNFARFCPPGVAGPDQESPTVPTGLTATPSGTADVALGWQPSSDNQVVTGYAVKRDGAEIATTAGTTFLDAAPVAGWHTYAVQAFDAAGNRSANSTALSIEVGPDTTPPSVPTGVTATVAGNQVTLTWIASTDNRAVREYQIFRNGAYRGWTTQTTFVDNGLAPGTYRYQLRAVDTSLNRSAKSPLVTATVV